MKNKISILIIFLYFYSVLQGQNNDSTKVPAFFSGVVTATNNGISLLPNFSLNRAAVLFDLSVGKGRLSFDPMFRFALDGKPWAFVFWWRYKLVAGRRFAMGLGAHPSFVFRNTTTALNGVPVESLAAQRYLAVEASPTYFLSKKANVGLYYLGSHGLTKDLTQYTHFLAFKGTISGMRFWNVASATLIPQLYYLKLDQRDGVYWNVTAVLSKNKFPLSISSIVSQAIQTEVAGKKTVWNVGLNYNFNQKYTRQ